MKQPNLEGKAFLFTVDAAEFIKLREYSDYYGIEFPMVEALAVEFEAENGSCLSLYFGFEGSDCKYHTVDIYCHDKVEYDVEVIKSLLLINERFDPAELISSYLNEKNIQ